MTAIAIATFETEATFRVARTLACRDRHHLLGEWLPYAPETMEPGRRDILAACVIAGIGGAVALFALECWSAIAAYPINAGARPLFAWPAFIPAPVEVGALTAAIGGIVVFFRAAALTRLHHPAFDLDEVSHASRDAFVLAVRCDRGEDANAVLAIFAEAGAAHSRLIAS